MALTDNDRQLIARAREVGPALRAKTSDEDRLAGWLLKELADLAERQAAEQFRPGQPITVADGGWTGTVERVSNEDRTAYVRFPDHPELVPYAFEALREAGQPSRCGDHHASGVTNCTRETGHDGAHHNGSGLTWGGQP